MKMNDVQKMAKKMGIPASRTSKVNMIRSIQKTEGNAACYRTRNLSCMEKQCCWREDCFS